MKKTRKISQVEVPAQAAALVEKMHAIEQQLHELTGGDVDLLTLPAGRSFLSRRAREQLQHSEATQRDLAAIQTATLDALPAHIALLDERGTIRSVNAGWRRFAEANGWREPRWGVGENYLAVCAQAHGEFSAEARAAADGIRAVLAGAATEFALEYPCDAPSERRWFRLMVRPMLHDGARAAVVMHVDMTERKIAEKRAVEAQAFNERLIETSPFAIITYRASGEGVSANAAGARLLGAPSVDAVRSQNFRHIRSWQKTGLLQAAEAALADGQMREVELHTPSTFGKEIWLQCRLVPLTFANEQYLLGFFDDIRARRLAEEALRQKDSLLHIAGRMTRTGGWALELSDQRVFWSDEIFDILEFPRGTAPELAAAQALYPDPWREQIATAMATCAQDGTPFDQEAEIFTATGQRKWIRVCGEAERSVDGVITRLQGAFQDISDAKRAQESLAMFRRLVDQASDGIYVLNADTAEVLDVNESACQQLGYPRAELLRLRVPDFDPEIKTLEDWQQIIGVLRSTGSMVAEFTGRRKDGSTFPVEIGLRHVSLNRQDYVLASVRDITERQRAMEALREREAELRALAESMPQIVWIARPDGWVTYVNQRWGEFTGLGVETSYGHSWNQTFHPDDRQRAWDAWQQAITGGAEYYLEARMRRADGSFRWMVVRALSFRDQADHIVKWMGTCTDIHDLKESVEAVRVSAERFRLLAKATHDALWDWDLVTNGLWWNEGFETMFGIPREEMEPTIDAWTLRIHPDDVSAITDGIHRSIASADENWSGEYRFRRRDGTHAYVLDRGYIIRNTEGRAVRMIGGMTDLTHRKETADRMAEHAALLDAASDAIILHDLAGRIVFWNRAAEQLFGWTAAESIGQDFRALLGIDQAGFDTATGAVLDQDHWHGEFAVRTKHERTLTIDVRWTLVRGGNREPKSVLAINTDITERKRLEMQMLRVQRMESIGTLAGGIAHDLNNILAPILMGVGVLRREITSPVGREMLDTLQSCSERGADLVQQVLGFARGVEGKRITVNLSHLAREIQKIIRETFPKNINAHFQLPRNLWMITGDPTQLHQVLMNLSVNARDAMPLGGTLTLAMENIELDAVYSGMNTDAHPGPYVLVKLVDTGTGIPPEIRERIFEPFFTTKEIGRGTGLGLSTTLAIVRSHGGFIHVYSEPGQGTTFKIHLPATPATTPGEQLPADPGSLPHGSGELVLVVDDEASIRSIAQRTLEHFGYRVLLAANGAEAVGLYARRRDEIAVVLTDMAMPVMDGPATIVALQAINPQVKIIGSSGFAAQVAVARASGFGVRHFIPKPYTADKMLATLAQILREPV